MTGGGALGPGREFDLLRAMLGRWEERARGIGDDTASLDVPAGERMVVSTDVSVENVHFRREWITPTEIGYRAVAAALSDLAAAGANAFGVLAALTIPASWLPHALELADGIGEAVSESHTHVLGGDLSSGAELSLAITVLGHVAEPLRRGAAQAGDALYLTGRLGGPFAAIRAWTGGGEPSAQARARFAHPEPRLREARWFVEHGAHAAIDISDGLLGDAAHLAQASGVRLIVELDAVRTVEGVTPEQAAQSGEEYEILVSAPPHLDISNFESMFGVPVAPVGRVERGPPEVHAMLHGTRVAATGGFSHFS